MGLTLGFSLSNMLSKCLAWHLPLCKDSIIAEWVCTGSYKAVCVTAAYDMSDGVDNNTGVET